MPKVDLAYCMTLPPKKAVEYLKNKGYAVTWDWEELWQDAQAQAFTVAKATRLDILQDIRDAVEKALKETEMPTMGMMYYNVPDMRIIPRLREGNNDDYLRRLEKAMDGHGIKPHRYLALSEVVYCL